MAGNKEWCTPKAAKRTRQKPCIFKCSGVSEQIMKPESVESWQALLTAAIRLGHSNIINASVTLREDEIPDISFHKRCRAAFILHNKRKIDLCASSNDKSPESSSPKVSCNLSALSFYIKDQKNLKNSKGSRSSHSDNPI